MSPLSYRLVILRVLREAKPYALPQATVLEEVNRRVRPALTLGDLVKHLSWLKAAEMAGFLADDLDPKNPDARKWRIREAGEAALDQ